MEGQRIGKRLKRQVLIKAINGRKLWKAMTVNVLKGHETWKKKILQFRGKEIKKRISFGRRKDDGRKFEMKEEKKEYT